MDEEGIVPPKLVAQFLQDIPVARNIYNDKIDALGEIILPKTNKFISEEPNQNPRWKFIVDNGMWNLTVPSIKTLKVNDPALYTEEKGSVATSLTDDEYFIWCKERGAAISYYLDKVMQKTDEGQVAAFKKSPENWMTETQKVATEYANNEIFKKRLAKLTQ